jgi:glycosyltransferase involved in cell wall biosynthesis
MKILYDYKAFNQYVGGVSRSFVELIKHMPSDVAVEVAVKYTRNIYFKEICPSSKYLFHNIYFPRKRKLIEKINLKYFQRRLKTKDYNLLHCTTDDCMFKYLDSEIPFVATIHDTIAELYVNDKEVNASGFINKYWLKARKETIDNANHLICVSENTKRDLLHFYPYINESKVSVIHHGVKNPPAHYNENVFGNYILYVGGRKAYKNFDFFVKTVAPVLKNKKINLICTGMPFTNEEKLMLADLDILHQTIHLFVDELTLQSLYYHAKLFVFPSLYEGFGMPLLEAMVNKCPMLISKNSCFEEIASDAAVYFNPIDPDDLRNALIMLLENDQKRNELIKIGSVRIKQFQWAESSEKLVNVYNKVLCEMI